MGCNKKPNENRRSFSLSLHVWIVSWFASCVAFNYSSKISTSDVAPWDAVHAQLAISVLLGGGAMVISRSSLEPHKNKNSNLQTASATLLATFCYHWKHTFSIATLLLGANGCMMLSLQDSSVELFQTIKASSPIFTVIVCVVFLGKSYSTATYATLIPICAGFAMTTYADIEATSKGVAYCIASSILQIALNLLVKRLYERSPIEISPLTMQVCINTSAAAILTFVRLVSGSISLSSGAPRILPLVVNGLLYFCENVCAYGVNKRTAQLPYSVIDTLRRLFIVTAAMVAFPKLRHSASLRSEAAIAKVCGVVLVIAGSVAFRVARHRQTQTAPAARGGPNSTLCSSMYMV